MEHTVEPNLPRYSSKFLKKRKPGYASASIPEMPPIVTEPTKHFNPQHLMKIY
jgi:hypothetical protein